MKKLFILLLALMTLVFCACSKAPAENDEDLIALKGIEGLVDHFLKNYVAENEIEESENKDTTPFLDIYEPPYQFDLSPYIDISREAYFGINLSSAEIKIEASDMIKKITNDLYTYGEKVFVGDGSAQNGDYLDINFKGTVDGVAFDGGTAENYLLTLGQGGFIDGFEEGIVGHKSGETFTIDVTFPEGYSESLSGKDAQFEITINTITRTVPAELTDEFVKKNFNLETINDYLKNVYKRLVESETAENESAIKTIAFNNIYANIEIKELPQEQYDYAYDRYIEDYTDMAKSNGMTLEELITNYYGTSMEEFYDYAELSAKSIVEQELVAFSIINAEELISKLTKGDYDEYLEKLAGSYGMDGETFEKTYNTEDIRRSFLLNVAINFVIENSIKK